MLRPVFALLFMLAGCTTTGTPERVPAMPSPTVTFTTPSEREVAVSCTFDAPRQFVWDAWTRCDHLRQWMLGPPGWSMTVCEIDLRPGGTQHLAWEHPDGESIDIRATFAQVRPPSKLVARERWGGNWPETINTLTFTEDGGRTHMTVTIKYPSQEARDAALQTDMKNGMTTSFERAAEYLATQR